MKSKYIAALLVALLVFISVGCTTIPTQDSHPGLALGRAWPLPDNANIATLGQEYVPAIIYAYFFTGNHNDLQRDAMLMGHVDLEYFWNIEMGGTTVRQMLLDGAMRSAKEFTAFYRLGYAAGITESPQEAAAAQNHIDALLDDLDGDQEMFVKLYRLSPEQMREVVRQLTIATSYRRQELDAIEVTEEIMRERYSADPGAFDFVTVRHILLQATARDDEAHIDVSGELAGVLLDRINAGEEIGELAAEYSEDFYSRDRNGEYTFQRNGQMVPEFEQWAFAATPGDTGIVRTMHGYHVMQLMSRTSFEELDPAAVEHQVRILIFEDNHRATFVLVNAGGWVYDYEMIDRFIASM